MMVFAVFIIFISFCFVQMHTINDAFHEFELVCIVNDIASRYTRSN